jgi:hypothetical protein
LAPEVVRAVVDALRSGMNPRQAGEAAGVSTQSARAAVRSPLGLDRRPRR